MYRKLKEQMVLNRLVYLTLNQGQVDTVVYPHSRYLNFSAQSLILELNGLIYGI